MFSMPCNLGTGCRLKEPDGGRVQDIGVFVKNTRAIPNRVFVKKSGSIPNLKVNQTPAAVHIFQFKFLKHLESALL
jgi:hypothetical protein